MRPEHTPDPSLSKRRLYLRVAVKSLALLALLVMVSVLISSMFATQQTSGPRLQPMTVDLSGIASGSARLIDWHGRPVIVLHRDVGTLAALWSLDTELLADPDSEAGVSGDRAGSQSLASPERSQLTRWFVAYGSGGEYGCPVEWRDPVIIETCGGLRYDAAGRVYADQPIARNLAIPPYRIEGSQLVLGAGRD